MITMKNALMHSKVTMTKFQIFSVILLLFFMICDAFMFKWTFLSPKQSIVLFGSFSLQFIFCIVCLCKNYKGFCLKLRKSEKLRQKNCPLKPQSPAFLHTFFRRPEMLVVFCFYSFCCYIYIICILSLYFSLECGYAVTALTIVGITFLILLGNIFQYQCTSKTGESQEFEIKRFFHLIAFEKVSFLKTFLKLDLVVNVILCIYTFCTGCATSFFLIAHYPVSLMMVAVSFHYTISNIDIMLYQKKVPFNGLFRCLLIIVEGFFCLMLPFCYCLLYYPLPFWSYFLAFSVITVYVLCLNKFGKYPFIDYELFDPDYDFCGSDLYQRRLDVCPYCEFGRGDSHCLQCPFEPEPLYIFNKKTDKEDQPSQDS